jgi:hypothetical protein
VTIATNKICPACGKRARFFSSHDSMGWVCSTCPWSAISRNYEHPVFDRTLYTIWAESRGRDPRWVIVQLAQVLGMTSREVRAVMERGEPIARDVPGGIVCHLHGRLYEAGVGIRVEPGFLWNLEQPRT